MYEQHLQVARNAAAAAADIIRRYHSRGVTVETKADASPVTIADREAERAIRDIIGKAFPTHAFHGEEFGQSGAVGAEYRWLVDPLDGTKSFIRRQPFFSTQIALMYRREIVLGVSCAPVYGEEAWALRGGGAWLNGERIHVSEVSAVAEASLSSGNIATLAGNVQAWRRYGDLLMRVNRVRGYGDFCHYHLLARGALDIVVESDLNVLDVAALGLIVEEAGGKFTTLSGGPLHENMRSVLATNGHLHEELLQTLAWSE